MKPENKTPEGNKLVQDNLVRIPLKLENLRMQREIVLAEPGESTDLFIVKNIPAFTYGVAYGDLIQLIDEQSGEFRVIRHSGQITLRVFSVGGLEKPEIHLLIDKIIALKGIFEVGKTNVDPTQKSLLLISLDISIGFGEIEKLMSSMNAIDNQWEYGNIYDENGAPLGWWKGYTP